MDYFINDLNSYNIGKIHENISLKNYTTYKVGGIARVIIIPDNIEKLVLLLKLINKYNLKYKIIGNGSNLVFSSKYYNDVLIKLDRMDKYDINPDGRVIVGAGYSLIKLSNELCDYSLKGLEFASGIPGTIGGAIVQNAGAYGSDMSNVVESVTVIEDGIIKDISNKKCKFGYRTSLFKNKNIIIVKCVLKLSKGNKDELKNFIKDKMLQRIKSQPIECLTAGSVFRNGDDYSAWKLISDCNLKGYKIGGAMVSLKHANFIVNYNSATGEDIYNLVNYIKECVYDRYKIELVCEQEFVNFDNEGDNMDKYIVVTTLCDKEDIKNKIVDSLLDKRLVSGSQVVKVHSKYYWNNKIEECDEYKIELRTKLSKFNDIKDIILSIHDYKLPEISYRIIDGANEDIFKWIDSEVK